MEWNRDDDAQGGLHFRQYVGDVGLVDDEKAVVELVGGLDREFGRGSQCLGRAGSRHGRRCGAMMRRAVLRVQSCHFESQGATGESGRVR